jgi:hypothetical protein
MPRAVNSFDVFDTLIGRRSVEPVRVLEQLESKASLPGLAAGRLAADRYLGSQGQPYTLHEIWNQVGGELGLDASTTAKLWEMEVQIEREEVIPIVENLDLVRDGDLLVSDTYLPRDLVLSLLRRAGLKRQVALVSSNDGKFRGRVWPQLVSKVTIHEHLGDNPHSDGKTAAAAGIRAIIYHGAKRTRIEQMLVEKGWRALANLVREVRLANPFAPARSHERYLWNLACQLNFPLLFFASLILERHAEAVNAGEIFFVSRDCHLWHKLFEKLFPKRRSTYLFTSRRCLIKPTESYLEYFRSTWHARGIIVDLLSTGTSWARIFAHLGHRAQCFFIGFIDNYRYLPDACRMQDWLTMHVVVRISDLGIEVSKGIEMLNYATHPIVEDVLRVSDGAHLPVLAEALEYDLNCPEAVQRAFAACVDALGRYPELPRSGQQLGEIVAFFVRQICADRQLFAIYPRHLDADAAYQRSLTP